MQDEQHRVIAVLATDQDPLVDFTDPDKPFLHDPVRVSIASAWATRRCCDLR